MVTDAEIDRQWEMVYFGRAPDANYSTPIPKRRQENIIRAQALYADMLAKKIDIDDKILSSYISVYSEVGKTKDVYDIIDFFKEKHEIAPTSDTFGWLVRMHILSNDITSALARFQEMKDKNIVIHKETYGLLIQSLTHRDMLVEAIKLVEEAADKDIVISNRHIKKLRNRFENLEIQNDAIPEDPHAWVKNVKETRRNYKFSAKIRSKTQSLKSAFFR